MIVGLSQGYGFDGANLISILGFYFKPLGDLCDVGGLRVDRGGFVDFRGFNLEREFGWTWSLGCLFGDASLMFRMQPGGAVTRYADKDP